MGLSDTFTAAVTGQFYLQHRLHIDKNRLADKHTMQSHKYSNLQGRLGTTHSPAQSGHFPLAASFHSMKCCRFRTWNSFPSASSSMPRPSFSPSSSHFTAITFSMDQLRLINPFLWRCGLPVTPLVVGCNIASKCLYHVYQNICLKMLNNILFPRFDINS